MITREQYNEALDIVEAYHNQLFNLKINNSKELLRDWIERVELSTRTYNGLRRMSEWNDGLMFVEDINKNTFLKGKDLGVNSWREFAEEREYRKTK